MDVKENGLALRYPAIERLRETGKRKGAAPAIKYNGAGSESQGCFIECLKHRASETPEAWTS